MSVAAVLLAAGLSRRFGTDDKLAMQLDGVPLGLHAARTLAGLPLDHRIVVTGPSPLDWPGFTPVTNDRPEQGMGHSLALGVRPARALGVSAVLVALADMPFVSSCHFALLLSCYRDPDSIACSSDGKRRMPPALFGSRWFDALADLSGDTGARALLGKAQPVIAGADELADVDDRADFHAAAGRLKGNF